MQNFQKLDVWRRAYDLTLDVYRITKSFPREEKYGLVSQLRRCSVSIVANISEGCGRGSAAELARFLRISLGSACELESLVMIARDTKMLPESSAEHLLEEAQGCKRMLTTLVTRVKTVNR
jgi:four helix bundle protein